jgi:sigma-B regulation protein RsbU (phosphoserine phosphatase)
MSHKLQVLRGSNAGREYDLAEQEILLGRDPACQIVIDDPAASRKHARLVLEEGAYVIEDLRSRNHTYVNGEPISGKVRLKDNYQFRIGQTLFVFRSHLPQAVEQPEGHAVTVLDSADARSSADTAVKVDAERRLAAVLQITRALGRTLDLEDVLSKMLDGLLEIFPHADRALVLLLDGQRLVPKAAKHRRAQQDSIQYSQTIVRRAMAQRQAILSEDAAGDQRFPQVQSIADFRIRSIMCVPLLSQEDSALGVIQLDTQKEGAPFSSDDLHILTSVATQASISIGYAQLHDRMLEQARFQKEMDLAQNVQQSFLPHATPELAGYGFWAYYLAAGKVGGDFYDFLRLPGGNQAVLLGDVAGKGVPAALMMAKASTMCKLALWSHPHDLTQAVGQINNEICAAGPDATFVTLVLSVIDPRTHEITFANAGHMSPMLRRADGTIDQPADDNVRGYPLGIARDVCYDTTSIRLAAGESVVLYSDGITDAMNARRELYTTERLYEQLRGMEARGPIEIGEALLADLRRHTADCQQNDDISLVVFGRV